MSGWVWEETLKNMCDILKRPYLKFPYKVYPHVAYCNKDELQEMWDECYEKIDKYIMLLDDPNMDIGLDLEKHYLEKIYELECQIEEIDYQWSRFSKSDAELEAERLSLPPLEPRVRVPDVRTTHGTRSTKKSIYRLRGSNPRP